MVTLETERTAIIYIYIYIRWILSCYLSLSGIVHGKLSTQHPIYIYMCVCVCVCVYVCVCVCAHITYTHWNINISHVLSLYLFFHPLTLFSYEAPKPKSTSSFSLFFLILFLSDLFYLLRSTPTSCLAPYCLASRQSIVSLWNVRFLFLLPLTKKGFDNKIRQSLLACDTESRLIS